MIGLHGVTRDDLQRDGAGIFRQRRRLDHGTVIALRARLRPQVTWRQECRGAAEKQRAAAMVHHSPPTMEHTTASGPRDDGPRLTSPDGIAIAVLVSGPAAPPPARRGRDTAGKEGVSCDQADRCSDSWRHC